MAVIAPHPAPLRVDAPKQAPRFVFISGCCRGGTTLAARLIGAHPAIKNLGRGEFCESQYLWRERFPDWSRHRWAIGPWRLLLRRTAEDLTPELFEYFRKRMHEASGHASTVLEKTPSNAMRIPFLNALFPACRFIHVLRDGRHTAASLIARKVWWPYAPHQWVGCHRTALADLRSLPASRYTLLRFEELIEAPDRALADVYSRCELPWSYREQSASLVARAGVIETPVDRWSELPRYRKDYILRVIRDLQAELDYPLTH
jgi:hypothetical protein